MKIFLSTWLTDNSLGVSLTKNNAKNRLLSYYFLREQSISAEHLKRYYERGKCDTRKRKSK